MKLRGDPHSYLFGNIQRKVYSWPLICFSTWKLDYFNCTYLELLHWSFSKQLNIKLKPTKSVVSKSCKKITKKQNKPKIPRENLKFYPELKHLFQKSVFIFFNHTTTGMKEYCVSWIHLGKLLQSGIAIRSILYFTVWNIQWSKCGFYFCVFAFYLCFFLFFLYLI